MRERPILMSGPLVRAIIDGRKTQTRRVVNGGPWDRVFRDSMTDHTGDPDYFCLRADGSGTVVRCPHGQVGDRLWVRETFAVLTGAGHRVVYRADGEPEQQFFPGEPIAGMKWTPSIHMPRWASRLTLRITDVRVERLQDISEEDARAEGCKPGEATDGSLSFVLGFGDLWDSIAKPGAAWADNPWVWALTFEREGGAA